MRASSPVGEGIYTMSLLDQGRRQRLFCRHNLWVYSWGVIAARCLGFGNSGDNLDYRVRTLFLEFENVASPGDAVAVPTISREEGIGYYDDLSGSLVRDYLRIPLLLRPTLSIEDGYEDYISEDEGNVLRFAGDTTGMSAGRHGVVFSNALNSKIFGIGLAASPYPDDPTRDIVYARDYYEVSEQFVKPVSGVVATSYNLKFL